MSDRGTGARPKCRGGTHNKYKHRPMRMRELQEQNDELLAMASIYEPSVFGVQEGNYSGHFCAAIELPSPFYVTGFKEFPGMSTSQDLQKEHQLQFLPPIQLHFQFPPDYPSKSEPFFKLSCKWLNRDQLEKLCRRLDLIWMDNQGDVVLFLWTAFLVEDTLEYLGIGNRLDLSWVVQQTAKKCRKPVIKPVGEQELSLAPANPPHHQPAHSNSERGYRHSTISQSDRGRQKSADRRDRPKYFIPPNRGDILKSDPRVVHEVCNLGTLKHILIDYNQQQREKAFNSASFTCSVCFEVRSGVQCIAFKTCDHVYCKLCMQSYFEVQIQQGNVKCLTCPYDKCSSQALPSQVRELVSSDLFAKYDELLLASTLDSMSDVIYCPRVACQCAVLLEPNSSMGSCPACFFVFCLYCRMGYHGVEPCRLKDGEMRKLFDAYQNGTREEKLALESRYGKAQLQRLVEGVLSESWVEENSKECPSCKAHIEKNDGCNKMTCWKCNCYFCWLCEAKLDVLRPYDHYDKKSGFCFGRLFTGLFDGAENEEEEEDILELDEDIEFGLY